MAIFKFRVYWEDDDSVYRDVVIKHMQTFFDLHKVILKCFEFDNKHNATFFRSNDKWQRGKEISLEKYEKKYEVEPLLMNHVTIGSEIRDPNQKFIYVYDFHKNWTFMVELINVNKEEDNKLSFPSCTRSEGIGPSQYGTKGLINEKLAEIEEKYDLNSTVMPDGFIEEGVSDVETETEAGPDEDVEENRTEEI
jgi:Fe-S-cluster formation regulator IscX/YfhJ